MSPHRADGHHDFLHPSLRHPTSKRVCAFLQYFSEMLFFYLTLHSTRFLTAPNPTTLLPPTPTPSPPSPLKPSIAS